MNKILAVLVAFLLVLPIGFAQYLAIKPLEPATTVQVPVMATMLKVCDEKTMRCAESQWQKCERNAWRTLDKCGTYEVCDVVRGCVARQPAPMEPRRVDSFQPIRLVPRARTSLTCPETTRTKTAIPPLPFDKDANDCALIGRGDEIEAFLTAMERIAASCLARRESAWEATQDAYENLLAQINALAPEPEEGQGMDNFLIEAAPLCTRIEPIDGEIAPAGPMDEEGEYYTNWLRRIRDNVEKYCEMIDEFSEPLVKACEHINTELPCFIEHYGGVPDSYKEAYRGRLAGKHNAATLKYEYTDFFYTNTLQTYGWGNFREYYHEESIECPGKEMTVKEPVPLSPQDSIRPMPLPVIQGVADESSRVKVKTPWFSRLREWLGLNPQPEPPKPQELVGLNHRPEPPMPVPEENVEYDQFGKVTKRTDVTKDESGRMTTTTTEMTYNALGQVVRQKETTYEGSPAMDKIMTRMTEFTYDKLGRVSKSVEVTKDESAPDKVATTITGYSYDAQGQVTRKQEQSVSDETSDRDRVGLNPQPEPPSIWKKFLNALGFGR